MDPLRNAELSNPKSLLTRAFYWLSLGRVRRLSIVLAVVASATVLCVRCAVGNASDRVLASVNGEAITFGQFTDIVPAPAGDSLAYFKTKQQLLDMMINQMLFVQQAKKLGFEETLAAPLEKKKAEVLRDVLYKYAQTLQPDQNDFARESAMFVHDIDLKLIEVSTFDTAKMVGLLLHQGVPFESLAARYNRFPRAAPDGDMGYLPQMGTPSEIRQAIKDLKPGEFTGLVVREAAHHAVYFDFVKFMDLRPAVPAESVAQYRPQIQALARQQKASDYLQSLRDRVTYDEQAVDDLTRRTDSLTPADNDRVVARAEGMNVRIGGLLPIVRGYGDVLPYAKRDALKEDIENDVLERRPHRLGLDRTREYQKEFRGVADKGIYQYYFARSTRPVGDTSQAPAGDKREPYVTAVARMRSQAKIVIDTKLLATAQPGAK